MKFFTENARKGKPVKSGILLWNLLDGWPQATEALVDYYFDRKIAFDVVARSNRPFVMLCGENANGRTCLYAVNDTAKKVSADYEVVDADTGIILTKGTAETEANGVVNLGILQGVMFGQSMLVIKWKGDENGFNHYITGKPVYKKSDFVCWYEKLQHIKI